MYRRNKRYYCDFTIKGKRYREPIAYVGIHTKQEAKLKEDEYKAKIILDIDNKGKKKI